ncbi:hypothetical protein GOP47_0006993 [Adiantum capillus-veneris]|uniref:DUF7025 domain-containing protein n=1 Tax=Adiantum capillus-veneris TaxID=13818 RepID=A0A9D4ZIW2_ADICA|nr:hypothetical protein GOP47_0006993 [Adiantum capillus-veneris]
MEDAIHNHGHVVAVDGKAEGREGDQAKTEEELKVKDPHWRWPTHQKWYSHMEGVWKTKDTTSSDERKNLQDGLQCPFEVNTILKEQNEDLSEVRVKLRSPYLISVPRKYLPEVAESNLCSDEPNVDAKDLFGIRNLLQDELKVTQDASSKARPQGDGSNYSVCKDEVAMLGSNECAADGKYEIAQHGSNVANVVVYGEYEVAQHGSNVANGVVDAGEDEALANIHLQHLLRFLDAQFKDAFAKYAWMKQEGLVLYNMLWAFLIRGTEVRRICNISGQTCQAVVCGKGNYDHKTWAPDKNGFKVKVKVTDFNGESFHHCTMKYKIPEFDGEVPFTSLPVCPWSFFSSQEQHDLTDHLQQRGQLFYDYAVKEPFRFMHFRGSLGFYERYLRDAYN